MIGIYIITNNVNGKCYIGQSINIKKRWNQHKNEAFCVTSPSYNYPLYMAFRKYGVENFKFEVLEECKKQELEEKEIFYIAKYKSDGENGYNQNKGGAHVARHCCFTDEQLQDVVSAIKDCNKSLKDIAADFNVSVTTIRDFNRGTTYRSENISYPIRKPYIRIAKLPKEKNRQKEQYGRKDTCKMCGKQIFVGNNFCSKCYALSRRKTGRPPAIELAKMVKENGGFAPTSEMFGVSDKTIAKWCKSYGIPHTRKELIAWYDEQMGIKPEPAPIKKTISEIVRPVVQIDINTMEAIATFASQAEAKKSLGINNDGNHISQVCRGLRKSAYGYFWQYE